MSVFLHFGVVKQTASSPSFHSYLAAKRCLHSMQVQHHSKLLHGIRQWQGWHGQHTFDERGNQVDFVCLNKELSKGDDVWMIKMTQYTDLCNNIRPSIVISSDILARCSYIHNLDRKGISCAFTCACIVGQGNQSGCSIQHVLRYKSHAIRSLVIRAIQ